MVHEFLDTLLNTPLATEAKIPIRAVKCSGLISTVPHFAMSDGNYQHEAPRLQDSRQTTARANAPNGS